MNIYDEMQDVATELLQEFKQGAIQYRERLNAGNEWEAAVYGQPINIHGGTVSGVSQRYVTDLITTADLHAILPVFGATPTNAGRLVIDSVERQIISVQPSPAAGTVVCWHVFVNG